jgi:hypothetical protein
MPGPLFRLGTVYRHGTEDRPLVRLLRGWDYQQRFC